MKPVVHANFSLPPALRFKTEYMFMHMLLPCEAHGYGLKKYFDFAVDAELYSLYHTGFLVLFVNVYIIYIIYIY
jgi:hypothetical protein